MLLVKYDTDSVQLTSVCSQLGWLVRIVQVDR